jgi:hypothetical protein
MEDDIGIGENERGNGDGVLAESPPIGDALNPWIGDGVIPNRSGRGEGVRDKPGMWLFIKKEAGDGELVRNGIGDEELKAGTGEEGAEVELP